MSERLLKKKGGVMALIRVLTTFLLYLYLATNKNVDGTRKCVDKCETIIDLDLPLKHLRIVQNITIQVKVSSVIGEVDTIIGYRAYRNELVLNSLGIWPEISEKVHMVPTKNEMIIWAERKECQIGRVCIPNGDCWGTSAQICRNNGLLNWVGSAHFQYEGVSWNKDLFRTCIKEWECWMKQKRQSPSMSVALGPNILIDKTVIPLLKHDKTYTVIDGMALLISTPTIMTRNTNVDCLIHKNDMFCELTLDNKVQIFSFLDGDTCTTFDSHMICITGPKPKASSETMTTDKERGLPATMESLGEIGEEMRASFVESMYNDMVLRGMIQNLMDVTNKLIVSSSRFNGMILHDILSADVHSTWTPTGIRACPCLPSDEQGCRWSKSYLRTNKPVGSCKVEGNVTRINLYGEDNLHTMIPDHLLLKSVGKTILESMEEINLLSDKKAKLDSGSSTGGSVTFLSSIGFDSIREMIWNYLPLVNLVLIFLLLARSCK